ncbi:proton-conducting transporter transmembrane domain-containing protein [Gemmata sp.]|uniref:proton-conducting transporter transmembrane domain-containing protein n=1 Tax=Gemmata sp. TaxID=1914242 RepID=UPI003F70D151
MTFDSVPWLELSVALPLVGSVLVGRVRDALDASRLCLVFTGLTLACTLVAWAGAEYGAGGPPPESLLPDVNGGPLFAIDHLSAPLLPLVALIHFLTALATARTKMTRFSFAWLLAGDAMRLATYACAPWLLGPVLVLNTLPPYFELVRRGRPTRVYVLHMGLFAVLLTGGLALGGAAGGGAVAPVLLLLAVLVRSGTVPVHVWVTDLFENCSFGTALLFVTPIAGMYAAVRLVLPAAPDWVLNGIGVASLVTAVYAGGMAVVQRDARRFFAFLFLSHASLALVGLELHTVVSLTGALALWVSVALSLSGLGLTIRALEARFGRLPLTEFRGLYAHSPSLAICFGLTGLASVGFPGTLGFVAAEVLVDGAIGARPLVGVAVVLASAINGIAVMRAYFLLFTGTRAVSGVPLGITVRERVAVLTLAALLLGGGLVPQFNIASRHRAAEEVLRDRATRVPSEVVEGE